MFLLTVDDLYRSEGRTGIVDDANVNCDCRGEVFPRCYGSGVRMALASSPISLKGLQAAEREEEEKEGTSLLPYPTPFHGFKGFKA